MSSDGHLTIWRVICNVYPQAVEQRCSSHKILNVLDKLMREAIPYVKRREEIGRLRRLFTRWCTEPKHHTAAETLERDWNRMVAVYDFPNWHWAAPDDEPVGSTILDASDSDERGEALQASRPCDNGELEDKDAGCLSGSPSCEQVSDGGRGREGHRMSTLAHLLKLHQREPCRPLKRRSSSLRL